MKLRPSLPVLASLLAGLYMMHFGHWNACLEYRALQKVSRSMISILTEQKASHVLSSLSDLENTLPTYPSAYHKLGELYVRLHQAERAELLYEKAQKQFPEEKRVFMEAWLNAAFLHSEGQVQDRFEPYLKALLQEEPQHKMAKNLYAIRAYQMGQHAQAQALWYQLIQENKEPDLQDKWLQLITQSQYESSKITPTEDMFIQIDVSGWPLPHTAQFLFITLMDDLSMPMAAVRLRDEADLQYVWLGPAHFLRNPSEECEGLWLKARLVSTPNPLEGEVYWESEIHWVDKEPGLQILQWNQ